MVADSVAFRVGVRRAQKAKQSGTLRPMTGLQLWTLDLVHVDALVHELDREVVVEDLWDFAAGWNSVAVTERN